MRSIPVIVTNAIHSDTDWRNTQDKRIIKSYKSATKPARQDIDDIFISLCGWSLDSIIKMRQKNHG